jgi:hypothetical protein
LECAAPFFFFFFVFICAVARAPVVEEHAKVCVASAAALVVFIEEVK